MCTYVVPSNTIRDKVVYLHICTSKPIKRKQWWRNTQKHSIKLPNLNIGLPWQQNSKKKNLLLHIKLLKKCPWWKQHGILNTEKEYRESSPRRRQSLRVNLLISSFTKKKWLKPSPNHPPLSSFLLNHSEYFHAIAEILFFKEKQCWLQWSNEGC